jgi:hypothetical protein
MNSDYDMDEGDPEMEAWMESLPPVDIDKLARDLKQDPGR